MRSTLLLAALAALFCGALAGKYEAGAGCYPTDTIKKYPIKGFTFHDFVKGQFVKHAFVQAKSRMRREAQIKTPKLTKCDFDGIMPVHACYNSVDPGTLRKPQVAGQYGFVAHVQYICEDPMGDYVEVKVPCKARLNTLRDNRLLEPSFWATTPDGPTKDIKCDAPTEGFPWV